MSYDYKDKLVYTREGNECGTATGATRRCQLEGCTGRRITVKWADGKRTMPCTKGLKTRADGHFQIM